MKISNLPDRIRKNLYIEPETNCWIWMGAAGSTRNGKNKYGHITINYRNKKVHRVVYELLISPIPQEKEIDHLCHNSLCCNPKHLQAVTHKENTRLGQAGQYQKEKTHCPQGHEYSVENTYVLGNRRTCRICNREKALRFYRKNRDTVNEKRYAKRAHQI